MSVKDSEKKFVGQPIFKQVIDFLPKSKFDILVKKYNSDKYYKAYPAYTQFVSAYSDFYHRGKDSIPFCYGWV
jgi:hypothetical protein